MDKGRDPPNEPVSLTVREVAARLKLSPITVYRHLASGLIPSFRVGRARRVLERDLEAFIERAKIGEAGSRDRLRRSKDPTERTGKDQ